MFRLILESARYRVSEAADGAAALILVKQSRPDLVVTDMVMPVMDGADLIRRLRSEFGSSAISILVVSGHPDAVETAVGADGVLKKPFDRSTLLARVQELLRGR